MSLKEYRAKRSFKKTPEPKGTKRSPQGKALRFVVQKHAARHLHYDFRLEHKGVLLSWAVPKGPPRTKGVKRLAIQVEDHPLSYADFEGTIPEGEYGAGTVAIWDQGTYVAKGDVSMQAGLKKGHIAVSLSGKKLKGIYDLVLLKRPGPKKMWILFKR